MSDSKHLLPVLHKRRGIVLVIQDPLQVNYYTGIEFPVVVYAI